ncbi:ferredoxin [Burkholderia gladioli BSR3]|uniref:Ferredoxin n=2 Tax=Burkholderia gladioli TaxID=28095 RepID=F2LPK8_BURGS|nr:ferredoxin [Burkholderia gladioli BSR3]MBW5288474.1 2Fe-2S iron-sulfur cluster binding domain-containing protein [Burkholderia gladioli]
MRGPLHFRCEHVVRMSSSVNAYWLRLLDHERYDECDLGKHIVLKYPDARNRMQRRSYSIAGRPESGLIEIAVKRQPGQGVSAAIHQSLTANSMLIADEVSGVLTAGALLGYERVLMVCGGVGITLPLGLLRGLARLAERGLRIPDVHLVACVPQFGELIYFTELLALQASHPWFTMTTFVTREQIRDGISYLSSGRPDPGMLARRISTPDAVVLCGSGGFVADWGRHLRLAYPDAVMLDQHRPAQAGAALGSGGPSAAVAAAPSTVPVRILLSNSGREIAAGSGQSLLEALESSGVAVPSQCRMGICGRCSVRVLDGAVESSGDVGLSGRERDSGYCLTCCSRPTGATVTLAL